MTPNLGGILYASPELAASLDTQHDTLAAGEQNSVTVHIAAARRLGEQRLEGEVVDFDGNLVARLPNRQVTLMPGRISTLEYQFTPPTDGA